MSDPIRIPIHAPRIDAHGDRYEVIDSYATVTPDLAAKIVALALADVCHPLNEHEKRIAALEADTAWLMQHAVVGGSDGQDAKPQPVADYDPAVSALCGVTLRDSDGDPVGLCSGDARTIVAAIRAGKVYGLGDVSALRAELAAERKVNDKLNDSIDELHADLQTEQERCALLEGLLAESVKEIRPRINRFSLGGSSSGLGPSTIDLVNRIDAALGKDKP